MSFYKKILRLLDIDHNTECSVCKAKLSSDYKNRKEMLYYLKSQPMCWDCKYEVERSTEFQLCRKKKLQAYLDKEFTSKEI
jgi:hypothetical protein